MKRILSAFVILTLIMFVVPVHVANAEDLADKMGKKYMWIWKSGSYILTIEKPWDGSVNALDVYIKTESEDIVLVGKIELMNEDEGRLHYKFYYYDETVNIGRVLFEQDKITVEFTDQEGVDKKLVFTECVQTYKDYIEMFGEQQVQLPSFDGPPGTYDDEPFDHIATYYRGEWHSIKPRNYILFVRPKNQEIEVSLGYQDSGFGDEILFGALKLKDHENGVVTYQYSYDESQTKYEGKIVFKNNAILFEYTGKDGFLKRLVFTERLLFSDVTSNHWAKDAIEYLAIKGILKGRDENFFEPEGKITRAEFAAVLVRILPNIPTKEVNMDYRDINKNAWYAKELEKAVALGIVKGDDRTKTMRPNAVITRAEMASMMARATSLLNKPIPSPKQLTFKDAKAIPNWAKDDINKIVSLGFMNGYPDQTFKPYGHGTRAEAAVVIKRFYDWVHQ